MPVAEEIARLLEGKGTTRLPPLHGGSLSVLREEFKRAKLATAAATEEGRAVSSVDVLVGERADAVPARWYVPKDWRSGAATVFLHGGGWVLGDLDTHEPVCRRIATVAQSAVLSVDYRLAPEHPFPAALEDAYGAVDWLQAKAAELGASPDAVAVAGTSAGGNLAAAVALRWRDRGAGHPLRAQLLAYPVLDPLLSHPSVAEYGEGFYLSVADLRRFVDAYLPDEAARRNPYAAPIYAASLEGLPPTVLATAEYDPLRDEGVAYGKRLQDDGVEIVHHRGTGLIHGYFGLAHLTVVAERACGEVLVAYRNLLHRPLKRRAG